MWIDDEEDSVATRSLPVVWQERIAQSVPAPPPANKPFCCPVCNGQGLVSRPPWVAGDVYEWQSSSTAPYPCKACQGTGVLWR